MYGNEPAACISDFHVALNLLEDDGWPRLYTSRLSELSFSLMEAALSAEPSSSLDSLFLRLPNTLASL